MRNARRIPVKAELPDDQRALKEDWDASAATRLTTRPCGKKELMHRTFAPVVGDDARDSFPLYPDIKWIYFFIIYYLRVSHASWQFSFIYCFYSDLPLFTFTNNYQL